MNTPTCDLGERRALKRQRAFEEDCDSALGLSAAVGSLGISAKSASEAIAEMQVHIGFDPGVPSRGIYYEFRNVHMVDLLEDDNLPEDELMEVTLPESIRDSADHLYGPANHGPPDALVTDAKRKAEEMGIDLRFARQVVGARIAWAIIVHTERGSYTTHVGHPDGPVGNWDTQDVEDVWREALRKTGLL